jgi:hypothetical protein
MVNIFFLKSFQNIQKKLFIENLHNNTLFNRCTKTIEENIKKIFLFLCCNCRRLSAKGYVSLSIVTRGRGEGRRGEGNKTFCMF